MAKQEKRIDTKRAPNKPRPYLMPIEWGGALPMTMSAKAKINKINTEGLKPPYLILCNHASFIDFPIVVRAIFPHRCSWVISVENVSEETGLCAASAEYISASLLRICR